MSIFSENLPQLRRRAGYTQEGLAEALGVSRQAVGKWESGQSLPEAATNSMRVWLPAAGASSPVSTALPLRVSTASAAPPAGVRAASSARLTVR